MSANSVISRVLIGPVVSEKATMVGDKHNTAVFKVKPNATKKEILAAVEKYFNVKVSNVNTTKYKAKNVTFGKTAGKTGAFKKAFIKLAEGSEFNFSGEQ